MKKKLLFGLVGGVLYLFASVAQAQLIGFPGELAHFKFDGNMADALDGNRVLSGPHGICYRPRRH
ncbi:MAG: hypothetical protein HC842_05580 [Cytophagales bacterium]|nr:hypothetical protein [Cytophagales bacterium]